MARPDEAEFERLVAPHRTELHAHCYRMLGSLHDTEEAMQEAMLRVWRGLDCFEGRSSLCSWLYKIATNTCLDAIARRKRRLLPEEYAPKADRSQQVTLRSLGDARMKEIVDEVEVFLRTEPLSGEWRWRHRSTIANGQLAVGTYTWMERQKTHVPFSLDVLTLEADRIRK